ncbi:MAG TPA: nickel-binding protein [Solirubrobacteraceae bacterium]|nr:nickel-binding protein [Solirubrobacteraceae bacterium]
MALFMDRHDLPDATAADIAAAHMRDLEVQDQFGVRFVTYWFEEGAGSGFCLVEGPDAESVEAAHRAAHGLLPSQVIEVDQDGVRGFFGRLNTHPAGEPYVESAFRAIFFTDIADSTRLTQELGDRGVMRVLREHDSIVRGALARYGGREVKHTGDGIMAVFASAYQAVGAAMQIQRDVHEREAAEPYTLHVRVGVAAGEPVTEHDDLFGAAVQQASRLCACAEPGRVVVSSGVYDLCRGKGLRFTDRGLIAVKGFAEPIGHYEAHWQG